MKVKFPATRTIESQIETKNVGDVTFGRCSAVTGNVKFADAERFSRFSTKPVPISMNQLGEVKARCPTTILYLD